MTPALGVTARNGADLLQKMQQLKVGQSPSGKNLSTCSRLMALEQKKRRKRTACQALRRKGATEMDESQKEMMNDIADTVRALCEALQDGCDDETTKEYSKAACRLARAYALLNSTR